jgi:hypothetical protein
MITTTSIDFFAINGRYSRYSELPALQCATPITSPFFPKLQIGSTDRACPSS